MNEHRFVSMAVLRATAWERQGGMCGACWTGMSPGAFDVHHRVRRRDLGHCACNAVALHPACHTVAAGAVHQRPEWARERGLIVESWGDPRTVTVAVRWPWAMASLLRCDGTVVSA